MKSATKCGVAAAVLALSGGLMSAPASAATQHCSTTKFPNKVELDGDRTKVQTGLPAGTKVCIKAGTRITIVYVDEGGYITQRAIKNRNGKALAISYYAYGKKVTPPPPPCEDGGYNC